MSDIGYFSMYARFETESKEDAAAFLGADNIIGDAFSIEQEYVDGKRTAWIVNPFGKRMGTIDEKTAEKVDLCNAKGWNTVALLALVAFTEKPEPGLYWGQVLIISYDPEYEVAFSTFIENVGKQLGEGIRPDVSLGRDSLKKVIETQSEWVPSGRVPFPNKNKGTAWVKTQRTGTERLVKQARKGNKGCTVVSWIFLLAVVALIVFGLHSCGAF